MPRQIFIPPLHRPPGTPRDGGRAFAGLAYPQADPAPRWFQQAWEERLDYTESFANWLPTGDTITSASVLSDDPRLPVSDVSVTGNGTAVTYWVGPGGVPGTFYGLTVTIATAGGRHANRCIKFFITGVAAKPSVAAALSGGGSFGTPPRPYGSDPIDSWPTG